MSWVEYPSYNGDEELSTATKLLRSKVRIMQLEQNLKNRTFEMQAACVGCIILVVTCLGIYHQIGNCT